MNTIKLQEESLFSKWRDTKVNWVKDGVVNPEAFLASIPKVVYILKEANGGVKKEWKNGDLRAFLNDANRWQTWNTVARWQYAIAHINDNIIWKKVDYISRDFRKDLLKNIAAINLKKEPGNQSSNMEEIKASAKRDLDLIRSQLSIYNPDIIICGGTGEIIKELNILGLLPKWEISKRNVKFCMINNTIVISLIHPGVRTAKKKLFWDLVHTLREAKDKYKVP